MQDRLNKTSLCSVVFFDIVGYSKRHIEEQIKIKNIFNNILTDSLKNIPSSDKIILDTGDGAAVTILGEPELAIFIAIATRDNIVKYSKDNSIDISIRTGINLGPVKIVNDINNQYNVLGDAINTAQRIMNFADINQILTSRTYYETVSCISESYLKLFQYNGVKQDKHVKEHETYIVPQSAIGQVKSLIPIKPIIIKSPRKIGNKLIALLLTLSLAGIIGGWRYISYTESNNPKDKEKLTNPLQNMPKQQNNNDQTVKSNQPIKPPTIEPTEQQNQPIKTKPNQNSKPGGETKSLEKTDRPRIIEKLREADSNRDGELSRDEVKIKAPKIYESFDIIDQDKSNTLSAKELIIFTSKNQKEPREKRLNGFFQKLGRDIQKGTDKTNCTPAQKSLNAC